MEAYLALAPYLEPKPVPGYSLEAFPGGQGFEDTTGGSAQFRLLFPWEPLETAHHGSRSRDRPRVPVWASLRDQVTSCVIVTATTTALKKMVEAAQGPLRTFIFH